MLELTLDRILAILGIVAAIVLVVFDKAGKLKGPVLLILLAVAALMTLPLALANSWVKDTPWGMVKFSKIGLMVSLVALCYSLVALWISQPNSTEESLANKQNKEDSSMPPACYIFPFGQVINGQVALMIANQTRRPIEDVDLDVYIGHSKFIDQDPQDSTFHKQIKWGTCKAMLTTSMDRFDIGSHPRVLIGITGTTKADGVFAENIELHREGDQYKGKTTFYQPLNTVRFSEDSILLPIVSTKQRRK